MWEKQKEYPQKNFGLIEKIKFVIGFKTFLYTHAQTVTQTYRGCISYLSLSNWPGTTADFAEECTRHQDFTRFLQTTGQLFTKEPKNKSLRD